MNFTKTLSFSQISTNIISAIQNIGKYSRFTLDVFIRCFRRPIYFDQLLIHVINFGLMSLPVIAMSSFFMGIVFVMHTSNAVFGNSSEGIVIDSLIVSITRELSPILIGLLMSGRIGAAISSEIASMKTTDQIEVLKTFNINPVQYLVVPRIIAITLTMPMISIASNILGLYGGYIVGTEKFGYNKGFYLSRVAESINKCDIYICIFKTSFFGILIAIIACYRALNSQLGGAVGVGYNTTKTVINSSIYVLLFNYLMTTIFF